MLHFLKSNSFYDAILISCDMKPAVAFLITFSYGRSKFYVLPLAVSVSFHFAFLICSCKIVLPMKLKC